MLRIEMRRSIKNDFEQLFLLVQQKLPGTGVFNINTVAKVTGKLT